MTGWGPCHILRAFPSSLSARRSFILGWSLFPERSLLVSEGSKKGDRSSWVIDHFHHRTTISLYFSQPQTSTNTTTSTNTPLAGPHFPHLFPSHFCAFVGRTSRVVFPHHFQVFFYHPLSLFRADLNHRHATRYVLVKVTDVL